MSLFRKSTKTDIPNGLIDLTKKAAVSLEGFYRDGSVQRLAEQTLALSANLDDDGTVPMSFFSSAVDATVDVRLDNYAGIVDREHVKCYWGGTNYAPAMTTVFRDYSLSNATDPALVIFQTDGAPGDQAETERVLRDLSSFPVFFAFVGFGGSIQFLERLDDLTGRRVDNASFFHAANPRAVTDEALYDGLTSEFASWLADARNAGIVR
ncbi:VWA domain-containing protein [Streptodolium elevatio]|uniref:VWA domain-containing protein n=1 Tax=Streptodolium elevatio TaxID=3157996 RepID=A0ABV3DJZ4_9ACTN